MKLYEINSEIEEAILSSIDPETGEITEEGVEALSALELAKEEKLLNIAKVVKSLVAEQKAYEAEKKRCDAAIKSRKGRIEWLRGYILDHGDGLKVKDAQASISYRTSKSVEVSCEVADLPADFVRVTTAADKTALKKALDAGAEVEGVAIIERKGVTIK